MTEKQTAADKSQEGAASHNTEGLREIVRTIASVVVLSSDGKLLMGRKHPDRGGVYSEFWHIIGGGADDGESLEDAARREAREEAGIDLSGVELKPIPLVGHGETAKTLPTGEKVWCRMTFNRFEARLGQPADEIEVCPSDDLVELRWFDPDELLDVEQIPGGREFFIQAGYIKRPT